MTTQKTYTQWAKENKLLLKKLNFLINEFFGREWMNSNPFKAK
ncbi:MAG: hypothetical protein Q7R95_01750 [bacterium]|nr:hypothetical protein [bacterium]